MSKEFKIKNSYNEYDTICFLTQSQDVEVDSNTNLEQYVNTARRSLDQNKSDLLEAQQHIGNIEIYHTSDNRIAVREFYLTEGYNYFIPDNRGYCETFTKTITPDGYQFDEDFIVDNRFSDSNPFLCHFEHHHDFVAFKSTLDIDDDDPDPFGSDDGTPESDPPEIIIFNELTHSGIIAEVSSGNVYEYIFTLQCGSKGLRVDSSTSVSDFRYIKNIYSGGVGVYDDRTSASIEGYFDFITMKYRIRGSSDEWTVKHYENEHYIHKANNYWALPTLMIMVEYDDVTYAPYSSIQHIDDLYKYIIPVDTIFSNKYKNHDRYVNYLGNRYRLLYDSYPEKGWYAYKLGDKIVGGTKIESRFIPINHQTGVHPDFKSLPYKGTAAELVRDSVYINSYDISPDVFIYCYENSLSRNVADDNELLLVKLYKATYASSHQLAIAFDFINPIVCQALDRETRKTYSLGVNYNLYYEAYVINNESFIIDDNSKKYRYTLAKDDTNKLFYKDYMPCEAVWDQEDETYFAKKVINDFIYIPYINNSDHLNIILNISIKATEFVYNPNCGLDESEFEMLVDQNRLVLPTINLPQSSKRLMLYH